MARELVHRTEEEEDRPAPLVAMTIVEARKSFTDDEQAIFKRISKYINKGIVDNIYWHWELGEMVLAEEKQAKEQNKEIEPHFLSRMNMALGYKCHDGSGPLQADRRLVGAFQTRTRLNEYLKLSSDVMPQLSYTHIVTLAAVSNNAERMSLAASAVTEGWDARYLGIAIAGRRDSNPKGQGTGRPPRVPKNERQCLVYVTEMSKKMSNLCQNSWSSDRFHLGKSLAQVPDEELGEKDYVKLLESSLDSVAILRNQLTELWKVIAAAKERAELSQLSKKSTIDVNSEAVEEKELAACA